MDPSTYKLYPVHTFDTRQYLEIYFSDDPDMCFAEDALKFPMENLIAVFAEGHIKGDLLIDISISSIVHHLYAASDFFKNMVVLKVSDTCILELKKWLHTRTGAYDWGHAAKLHEDIQGSSDQLQDRDAKVRSAIQHVVKYDLEKEKIIDPLVLPPADCIISAAILGFISKDQDDYIRYLKKFSKLLKPGGHLILIGCLGTTYLTVGKDKVRAFNYDEDFARNALLGEGFIIDYCKVKKRTAVSDLIDYQAIIFIVAHKEK